MNNNEKNTGRIAGAVTEILVVEDSDTQAAQIAELLRSEGYRVRIARNGRQGLEEARAAKPTLIVSDIAMPEMDGFAMCQEVKKDHALHDVPVILLTALTSLHDVIKGLDCGADNFIRKPFEGKYLLGRIRFILANRALRSDERVQLGMRVSLGGQTHFITAERQQIFDLLISTYEEAIQMTEELRVQQNQIAHSFQSLQGLYKIAEALNPSITESVVSEMALDRILDFPGVVGGRIRLLGAGGKMRTVATRDFDQALDDSCADCTCDRNPPAGALRKPEVVRDCELLAESTASIENSGHLAIPLMVGDRNLGVMNLLSVPGTDFIEEDLQVLHTVGNQVAIALERANLYSNMEALVKERTDALEAERNLLSAVVNTTGALVFLVDIAGRIVMFNPACEQSLGWKAEEVQGRHYWEIMLHPERAVRVKEMFERMDFSALRPQMQSEWVARDGSTRHVLWSSAALRGADQEIEYFLGTGIDVTELRHAEEKVQYLSNFDSLTGLPNRILLRDRIRLVQEKIVRGWNLMGFLLIHFARLPLIRESLGDHAEQEVLLQITSRLKEWAKGDDSVARVGDNTFAMLAVRPGPDDLADIARQILVQMDQPFLFDQQDLHTEAAIGITIFPNDGDDYYSLLQSAEVAMRRALVSKKERLEFYRPELNRGASERFKLESALRRALGKDEFLLYYQPQVDLRTGRIIGFEALLRWQHPELGLIPPGRFIGLAEETGLIVSIGEWALRKACQQSRAWQRAGLPKVPVAVNLSSKQFSQNIAGTVKDILAETGLDPTLLELELTETLSMEDPESTFEILRTLKEMGVQLAIDDFGTGYSNLNYLKRFPVDKLKIDRSFVCDLTSDPDDLSISRAVIAMAHSLRLRVIAEGVETEGQLSLLAQHGCDEIQGYLFSKPVEADECARYLREKKSLPIDKLLRKPYERTVLLINGEINLASAISRATRNKGYKLITANSAAEAFEVLATSDIGVVICDQRMPGMSGTEFFSRVKQMYPAIVSMVLCSYADLQSVKAAVSQGVIFKCLTGPWEDSDLLAALGDAIGEFESKSAMSFRN